MELLCSAFSSLKYYAVLIPRQVGYMIHYRSNLKKLKEELEELEYLRETVQHRIDAAIRNAEQIAPEIAHWLIELDDIVAEAEWSFQDERLERSGRSSTSLSDLWLRHRFGRRFKKMVSEIVQLRLRADFDRISYRVIMSCPPTSLASTERDSNSRVETREGILESLKDPNLKMIGVCGPAGVGKTTLVKQVVSMAEQDKLFDVVVFVTVSEDKDLERIQLQMADQLGINFRGESAYEKATRLCDRLMKEKSFLVILDDMWEELDLQEIGIPVEESFKIIIVSRSQKLLRDKMKTQKDFNITTLPENDAWNLFQEMAGIESNASPEFLSIATKVAAKCASVPVAIVTVANSLKGRNLEEWKNALKELEGPALSDITGTQEALNNAISLSIQGLEKDAESIFYLCGLIMGENDLAKSIMFNYSVGLGLFDHIEKRKDARHIFDACISMLEDRHLLMQGNSSEFLRMHDLIRDAAIFLASKHQRYFVRRHQEGEEWPDGHMMNNCITIMLSDQDIDEHPEGLNCQNISFFQLLTTDSSSKLPDSFFKGIHRFKVDLTDDFFSKRMPGLEVLDLTAVVISGLPSSISQLKMLTALFLDYSVLGHISDIGKLKDLKILSLSKSDIKALPHELGQLTQLQFLDLSYCFQLEVIPPNVFSNLKNLEELYMLGSFDDWDVNDPNKQQQSKASIVELTNLSCLTTLEVVIPNKRMLPGPDDINRLFASLERGKVLLGRQSGFSQFFGHETSAALRVWLNSTVNENVERLLAHVHYLGIGNLKVNIVPRLNGTGFPQLKYLFVGHCDIQYLADPSGNSNSIDLFPTLNSLVLHSVRNLKKLCSALLTGQSFSRLKFITVKNCNKLKSLFSFSLVNGLPHLCEINLESCYSMEGIVSHHFIDAAAGMLQFPELRNLYMENLPELIGFRCEEIAGNNNLDTRVSLFCDKVMSPNLEILDIKWTKSFKIIWQCSQLLSNCFGRLKKINIRFCVDLISIFPYQIISTIPRLETLTVAHCESLKGIVMTQVSTQLSLSAEDDLVNGLSHECESDLESCCIVEIIVSDDRNAAAGVLQFPGLRNLYMENLPQLIGFHCEEIAGNNNHDTPLSLFCDKVMSPNLEILDVKWTKKLKTIWQCSQLLSNCFGELKKIDIRFCVDLISIFPFQIISTIPCLETLTVAHCESLEGIVMTQDPTQPSLSAEVGDGEEIVFAKLKFLELNDCSRLRSFCSEPSPFKFPCLDELIISKCPRMEIFCCGGSMTPVLKSVKIDGKMHWEDNYVELRNPVKTWKILIWTCLPNGE